MRLGIFGGTFDPVHYGHLLLAESCREQLQLDQVWFLPAAVPPHKQERTLAPAVARAEMLELAIGGHSAFVVCRHEIERGGVNFTAETLSHIHAEDPTRKLFFLMGADSLRDLPNWKNPEQICELATPVMVCRGELGQTGGAGESFDWSRLETILSAERLRDVRNHQVHMPRVDLSSSEIRARVGAAKSIRFRTPRAVEKYIESRALYH